MAPHMAMLATKVMPSATVAATELIRMSRFRTCESSWASTPRSSSSSSTWRMPWVTQTAAWLGLRPVANAFGCISADTYSLGIGMSARWVEVLDDRVDLRELLAARGLRPSGLDRDGVAEPVRAAHEAEAEDEPDDEPGAPADGPADQHEQRAQRGEQDGGLECVLHGRPPRRARIGPDPRRNAVRSGHAFPIRPGIDRQLSRSSRCGSRRRGRPRTGTSPRCGGRPRWRAAARSRSSAGPTPTPA